MSTSSLFRRALLLCSALPVACQGDTSNPPMSADAHEAAARDADAAAVSHEAEYDPDAYVYDTACAEFCFGSNPTSGHKSRAQSLRRQASAHRKEAHTLRVAEERACGRIPEENRDLSPFFFRDAITAVETPDDGRLEVTFGRLTKTTEDALQELVDCHLARNEAEGFSMPEMEYCPLAVAGIEAKVGTSTEGLVITLTAKAEGAKAELQSRGRRLKDSPSGD